MPKARKIIDHDECNLDVASCLILLDKANISCFQPVLWVRLLLLLVMVVDTLFNNLMLFEHEKQCLTEIFFLGGSAF